MTDPAALLSRARDSLADARLLAEHRRANEVVLTRLALHQALQAVSLAEGLDADDGLRLDTLFRRVAEDHPQALRIAELRNDDAQTIAAVAALVEALSAPVPETEPGPERKPKAKPSRHAGADRAEAVRPRRDPASPTALDASPRGVGRAGAANSVPSAAFWALMDRWRVADLDALDLLGHAGGLTGKGTRPRFRLQGGEPACYAALRQLDTAFEALGLDPGDWLSAPRQEAPFNGETALALLRRDREPGARRLLRLLNRQGLAAVLATG